MSSEPNVNEIAGMDVTELDLLLGDAAIKEGFGSKSASDAEKVALGRSRFLAYLPELRKQLCDNETLKKLVGTEQEERNEIILGIAALLAHMTPVPLILAARVVHYGYSQLCPNIEGPAHDKGGKA